MQLYAKNAGFQVTQAVSLMRRGDQAPVIIASPA